MVWSKRLDHGLQTGVRIEHILHHQLIEIPLHPSQINEYAAAGDTVLVATLYSRREERVSELSRRFTFRAMARFERDPRAPPGLSMMEAWSPPDRTSQTMGPMWPCRTRKILLGFLQNSVGDPSNGHVLVLRRGMPAAERECRDVREVVVQNYPAAIGLEAEGDGSGLDPADYVTMSVLPGDDGFIVLPVPRPLWSQLAVNTNTSAGSEKWLRRSLKWCSPMCPKWSPRSRFRPAFVKMSMIHSK